MQNTEAKSIALFVISLAKSIVKSAISFELVFEQNFYQSKTKIIGSNQFGMEFGDFVPNLNRFQEAKSIWLETRFPNQLCFLKPIWNPNRFQKAFEKKNSQKFRREFCNLNPVLVHLKAHNHSHFNIYSS